MKLVSTTLLIAISFNIMFTVPFAKLFPLLKLKKKSFITVATFKLMCEASDMKKKKRKLLKKLKMFPFGLPLTYGQASRGDANGLAYGILQLFQLACLG